MNKNVSRVWIVFCVSFIFALSASAAQVTSTFTGAVNSDFMTAGNWTNGVPNNAGVDGVINTGGVVLAAPLTVTNLTLANGTLSGAGNLAITGTFSWSGGTLDGTGGGSLTIPEGGTFAISGGGTKQITTSKAINLAGNATVTGGGPVVSTGSASTLTIQGGALLDIQNDQSFAVGIINISSGGILRRSTSATVATINSTNQLNNNGLLDVQTGTLSLDCNGNSSGTFNVANGATLSFDGGADTLNTGAAFTGTGMVQLTSGTLTINATLGMAQFTQSGGTCGGSGTFTITGSFAWTGGFQDGTAGGAATTTVASTATLSVSGNAS